MSTGPIDNIHIQIDAELDSLRSQMAEANKIVERSTEEMRQTTDRKGPFASLFGGFAGLAKSAAAIFALKSSLDIATASVRGFRGEGWLPLIRTLDDVANKITFGISGALRNLRNELTGTGLQIRNFAAQVERDTAGMVQRLGLRQELHVETRAARFDIAATFARGPLEQAAVERARERERINILRNRAFLVHEEDFLQPQFAQLERRADVAAVGAAFPGARPEQMERLIKLIERIELKFGD